MSKAAKPADNAALKRLGGGRWQTRDGRFTIEPQSGTWVVVDAEQTDDLGLPLVRGPFASLAAARDAIAGVRVSAPAVSSLAARVAEHRDRPPVAESTQPKRRRGSSPPAVASPVLLQPEPPAEPPPPELAWIRALPPYGRKRAHELIDRLTEAGVPDAEELAQREIVRREPAIVAFAVQRAVAGLGSNATPEAVTRLVVSGAAAELGVQWHLVDGEGRRVELAAEIGKGRSR